MARTLTVTGHGTATAVPDTAVLDVAVVERAADLADAVAGVDLAVVQLVRSARGLVEQTRVQSTGLQVWPTQDPQGRPAGFEATHHFRIACPGLPTASALVAGLVGDVGDRLRVHGVRLEVGDVGPAQRAAREAAFADAQDRATHLAGLAGHVPGDVLTITEGAADQEASPLATRTVSLEPGETQVRSAVTVVWQLV